VPVEECSEDGKSGYRWGSGKCYTYSPGDEAARKKAKQQAYLQGSAIAARTGEPMKASLLHYHKAFHPQALPPLDKAQALALINELAHEPVEEKDVYVARAQLANDRVDRSGERFPVEYLERFAATLPGKPLLLGHDKSSVPAGRWISASVARDSEGTTHLVGDFYLDADSEAVRLLKLGIAKDMSIGFVAGGRACDLCGEPVGKDHVCGSGHKLNQEYHGVRCTATYTGDLGRVEALEGSLVGVGCQIGAMAIGGKAAGAGNVLAAWELEEREPMNVNVAELEARVKMLEDENATLTKEAAFIAEGKQYRADLLGEIERKAGLLERNIDLDKSLLKHADIDTLKAYDEQLGKDMNVKFPPQPQSKMLGQGADVLPELGGGGGLRPVKDDPFFLARRS
jgi:hypothetical protein